MNDVDLDRDELLQRFLDGDLSPEEAEQARSLMSSDADFRRGADSYRRLGHLMRDLAQSEAFEQDLDRMWERVSQGTGKARTDDVAEPSASVVWLSEFFTHRKRYWIPAAGAVAAAAAAALVVALHVPTEEVAMPVPAPTELRSRVTDLSLHSASTLVFEVETESGGTAAVLWVTAEDEDAGQDETTEDRQVDGEPVEEP